MLVPFSIAQTDMLMPTTMYELGLPDPVNDLDKCLLRPASEQQVDSIRPLQLTNLDYATHLQAADIYWQRSRHLFAKRLHRYSL